MTRLEIFVLEITKSIIRNPEGEMKDSAEEEARDIVDFAQELLKRIDEAEKPKTGPSPSDPTKFCPGQSGRHFTFKGMEGNPEFCRHCSSKIENHTL